MAELDDKRLKGLRRKVDKWLKAGDEYRHTINSKPLDHDKMRQVSRDVEFCITDLRFDAPLNIALLLHEVDRLREIVGDG